MCGALNPVGNLFCDRCHARLVPVEGVVPPEKKPADSEDTLSGVKGISLPSRSTASDTPEPEPVDLPDWLQDLSEETSGAGMEEAPGSAPESPPPAADLPDWLRDLRDEPLDVEVQPGVQQDEPDEADLPEWLQGLVEEEDTSEGDWGAFEEPEPASEPEEELAPADLPDWLLGPEEEPEVEAPEPEYEEAWSPPAMEDEPERPDEDIAPSELPGWFEDVEEETGTPSADVAPTQAAAGAYYQDSDLPEWLLTSVDEEIGGTPHEYREPPPWLMKHAVKVAPSEATEVREPPAWITGGAAPEVISHIQPEEEEELPDWMAGLVEEEAPAGLAPQAEAAAPVPAEAELPDWLSGLDMPEEAAPQPEEEEELPDWMAGLVEEEAPAGVAPQAEAAAPAPAEAELPDWLSGLDMPEEAAPQPEPEEEEELPDWMAGLVEEEAPAGVAPQAEAAAPVPAEAELPDWLSGLDMPEEAVPQSEPEEEEELPDWMAGLVEEESPAEVALQAEAAAPVPAEAELPDWLSGITEMEEPSEVSDLRFAEAPEMTPPPTPREEIDAAEEESDFLLKDSTGPAPTVEKSVVVDVEEGREDEEVREDEEGEVPDWLQSLPAAQERQAVLSPEEAERLARANVPQWLQGLRPPGTGPLPPLEDLPGQPEVLEDEGDLARAEIPGWLQQLKPQVSPEGEVSERVIIEPSEEEGPLSGIPGVLPSVLKVDLPADYEVTPQPQIPDPVVEQARLWQELLSQPRGTERPVTHRQQRPGWGARVVRWAVFLLLLVGSVAAIFLLPGFERLSQAPDPGAYPGIVEMRETIESLDAGDDVVIAVEYGMGEAEEMLLISESLVEHLAERDVNVLAVSTLPEGPVLIPSLLEFGPITNQVSTPPLNLLIGSLLTDTARVPAMTYETPFLAGSADGIASFLALNSVAQDADLILVISARAERLRWWVEQNSVGPQRPMAVVLSRAAGPLALPYLATGDFNGWIVGLPEIVTYRELRGLPQSQLSQKLDVLMLAHWAVIGLLIFGLVYNLAAGRKGTA